MRLRTLSAASISLLTFSLGTPQNSRGVAMTLNEPALTDTITLSADLLVFAGSPGNTQDFNVQYPSVSYRTFGMPDLYRPPKT